MPEQAITRVEGTVHPPAATTPAAPATASAASTPAPSTQGYVVTSQYGTVQVQPDGSVLDVEAVGFATSPHNVSATVYVPLAAWTAGNAGQYIAPLASGIEYMFAQGLVSGASSVQDVDPATSLLADFIQFVVAYQPPHQLTPMTAQVRVPVSEVANDPQGAAAQALRSALATLKQTAGF